MARRPHKKSQNRTDEKPDEYAPPPPIVSPRQQQALQALLTGATDTEAAETANVTRETVNRWRHRDANFVAALNKARKDLSQGFHNGLRALLPDALAALREGLRSESISLRIRVAETLIRALRTLGESDGSTNPEFIRLA